MAELDTLKDIENEENDIKREVEAYQRDLAQIKEQNVIEKVELDYETNKNWINVRDKKKQLELKNKDLVLRLGQSEVAYKKAALIFEEKTNQSYNYFEQKQLALSQKKDQV